MSLAPELRAPFAQILLSVERADDIAQYLPLGLSLVAPLLVGGGLVARLHAVLLVSRTEHVVALDLRDPLPTPEALEWLCHASVGADGLLATAGWTPARYRRSCLRPLERGLRHADDQPSVLLKGLRLVRRG